MRVNLVKKWLVLSVLWPALAASGFFLPASASAKTLTLSQSILPVRFVYLNSGGEIEKIWSNISGKDSRYVMKFFDAKSQLEISGNENTLLDYQDTIRKSQLISGTITPGLALGFYPPENKFNLAIDFIRSGNSLEEVHTYT